jgi:hypothetical protein
MSGYISKDGTNSNSIAPASLALNSMASFGGAAIAAKDAQANHYVNRSNSKRQSYDLIGSLHSFKNGGQN